MKKLILAASVCLAFTHAAMAQSSVTMFGVVDAGFVPEAGGPAGHVNKVTGGVSSASRIGFRGKEDLGGGMAVDFWLEAGILLDTGAQATSGVLFNRQAFIGLRGDYGYVSVGRQYTLIYLAYNDIADPFKLGTAARGNNILQVAGTRLTNSVHYFSPTYRGVMAEAMYAPGEQAGTDASGRSYGAALGYVAGPLATRLVYSRNNDIPLGTAAINTLRVKALVASYDFKPLQVHAGYGANQNDTGMDSRDAIVGVTYLTGPHRLMASLIHHDERGRSNADVNQAGIGWYYSLTKRTNTYLAYAKQDRKNAAAAASFFVGNSSETGSGDRAWNLGVRHVF